MAIVADLARENVTQHNIQFFAGTPDTHVNFAYEAGTNNTADAWVPSQQTVFNETP